ncbi:helix-turn-helix domain-containing protein [Candidatus Marinimicrobia bacterium]|nr:helix-turn-helix domain-containing protein [Candidatus Neomarinimicrobiota bacterium]
MEYRIVELLKEIKSLITGNKQNKWMDINEASKYCSVHPSTLRRNVASGQLSASNKLGKSLFKQSELESWLNG